MGKYYLLLKEIISLYRVEVFYHHQSLYHLNHLNMVDFQMYILRHLLVQSQKVIYCVVKISVKEEMLQENLY